MDSPNGWALPVVHQFTPQKIPDSRPFAQVLCSVASIASSWPFSTGTCRGGLFADAELGHCRLLGNIA